MGIHNGFIINKAVVIEYLHAHIFILVFGHFWFLLPSHPSTDVALV